MVLVLGSLLALQLVVMASALTAAEKMQAPSSFILQVLSLHRERCVYIIIWDGPSRCFIGRVHGCTFRAGQVFSLTGSGSLTALAVKRYLAVQPHAASVHGVER